MLTPVLRKRWEDAKGLGHAGYATSGLIYGANKTDKLEFQDDLYNSHMDTISSDLEPMSIDENQAFEKFVQNELIAAAQQVETEQPDLNVNNLMQDELIPTTEQVEAPQQDLNALDQTDAIKDQDNTQNNQPTSTIWNNLVNGSNATLDYTATIANDAADLISANPITSAAVVATLAAGTGAYLYHRYYGQKPSADDDDTKIDEQE